VKTSDKGLEDKFDTIIALLQHLLALELAREGASHQAIAKHLHVAKASVGTLLKGVKRRDQQQ
jgi:predicted transcriptional regulator